MKKLVISVLAIALGGLFMGYIPLSSGSRRRRRGVRQELQGGSRGRGGPAWRRGGGGWRRLRRVPGGGGNFGPRQPMTVELAKVVRASIAASSSS